MKNICRILLLAAVAVDTLAGCGGSSSTPAASPSPASVAGVVTPKAVSVVTAN